jgi:acetyl/propionyl-CoA carboxylase alpha subunit
MNTRLQVEHPITEMLTGLDLVHWQIRVANGERFPFLQSDFSQRGHAIECRIYAEDPANGFLPSTGKLLQFIEPRGPGIRVDSGFALGSEVTHFYDPLLAKLIVHAEDRASAIQRMQAALQDFVVHGVITNIDFLQTVLSHPDFYQGRVTTRWVEQNLDKLMESNTLSSTLQERVPELHIVAAALADLTIRNQNSKIPKSNEPDAYSPWKVANGFRLGGHHG